MTEHHESNDNNNNNDYCYTSTCLLQKANEMIHKVESETYWNNIRAQDYLNNLDKQVEELERLID